MRIKRVHDRLEAVVTAFMDADSELNEAHEAADGLARRLHAKLPEVDRVVVHVEPEPA